MLGIITCNLSVKLQNCIYQKIRYGADSIENLIICHKEKR